MHDLTTTLERFVELPDDQFTALRDTDSRTPELAAARLRHHWGYSSAEPIPNVVRDLENSGAVTARFSVDQRGIDAFSVPFASRPVIILTDDKANTARSRFDAAHEAGHLLLHDIEDAASKELEQEAHRFAAELLMPAGTFVDLLPRSADWHALIELKVEWRVSLAAQMYRARALGVWSPQTYLNAIKTTSKNGWRTAEPGDTQLGAPESPWLLRRAMRVLEDDGVDIAEVADAAAIRVEDIKGLVNATADSRRRL